MCRQFKEPDRDWQRIHQPEGKNELKILTRRSRTRVAAPRETRGDRNEEVNRSNESVSGWKD
jgi:hypothetical protein